MEHLFNPLLLDITLLNVQSVELTNEAIEFLKGIFDLFDGDGVSLLVLYTLLCNSMLF